MEEWTICKAVNRGIATLTIHIVATVIAYAAFVMCQEPELGDFTAILLSVSAHQSWHDSRMTTILLTSVLQISEHLSLLIATGVEEIYLGLIHYLPGLLSEMFFALVTKVLTFAAQLKSH